VGARLASHVSDWLIFLVGPLVWMYVRRLTMHETPRLRQFLVHCVPATLVIALLTPFYLMLGSEKRAVVAEELAAPRSLDPLLLLAMVQTLIYWFACLITLRRFRRSLRDRFTDLNRLSFGWLSWVLAINLGMWLFWVVGLAGHRSWVSWLEVIAVPLGMYLLAFLGARQLSVFVGRYEWLPLTSPPAAEPASTPVESPPSQGPEPATAAEAGPRYQRSGLDRSRIPELRARLELLMCTEKPWLENDLTLAGLAERAGLSPHHLSQLLNESLGVTFFDFINAQRIQEVQRCLADRAYEGQAILDIALAAGFSSKAAFNAAFKQHTGLTPSQFRRQAPDSR
jgi:AraC-like DNA-binding protein